MALSLVTAPATEPLTLAEAKSHLKSDVTDEDALIDGLIRSAREYVETFTHRALITQTWDLRLEGFPSSFEASAIWLPKPPLVSVTSISYVDTAGATQTWASSNYTVDAPAGPWARMGRIVPAWSIYFPVTRSVPNAVTVRFVAGYGAATAVPSSMKSAMKLLIGNWWANREAGAIFRGSADILPFGVEPLLWPYKAF